MEVVLMITVIFLFGCNQLLYDKVGRLCCIT